MRARSRKREAMFRIYRKRVALYLAEHPHCLRCAQPAVTVHHRRGRTGFRLLDETWWAPSCEPCNTWAEEHTGDALATGWLVRIEGVA